MFNEPDVEHEGKLKVIHDRVLKMPDFNAFNIYRAIQIRFYFRHLHIRLSP